MFKKFRKKKNISILATLLLGIVFIQALWIGKLYSERDDKNYEVNLVKINTEKDSIDYLKMKNDMQLIDNTVRQLNQFLASKSVSNEKIEKLEKDSLNTVVYLSRQSNRYSQYLVNLQKKLQQVPLGMPTGGYISSNFGIRKNPIPFKTMVLASVAPLKPTAKPDSLAASAKNNSVANNAPAEKDQMQFHKGLDIAVGFGSDVRAAAQGKVIFSGNKGGYGNCVIISHGNGLATLYGHLSQLVAKINDEVNVGDVIAKSGNSGRSTGPHLHYEVHKNNKPVNPKLFMNL